MFDADRYPRAAAGARARRQALLVGAFACALAVGCGGCPRSKDKRAEPHAPGVKGGGSGRSGGAATAFRPASGDSVDQLSPALTASPQAWIVGWSEDRSDRTRVVVSSAADLAASRSPHELASGPHAGGLQLAATAKGAMGVWLADGKVWARPLTASGAPRGKPRALAGPGDNLGPPAVVALSSAKPTYAVVWVEGKRLRAAKLDAGAAVAARTWWHGGNERPTRGLARPQRKGGPSTPAPPAAQRARPAAVRPMAYVKSGALHVRWVGSIWRSDDLAGTSAYRQRVDFKQDHAREPQPIAEGTWRAAGALAVDAAGRLATVEAYHNPNGGPWKLSLVRAGAKAPGLELTSERAGPLPAALVRYGKGFLAAWYSPQRTGVAVARIGAPHAAPKIHLLGAYAPPGEAALALAARGKEARVAYVHRVRGLARVTVADIDAKSAVSRPKQPPPAHALADSRAVYADPAVVRFDSGAFAVIARDERSGAPRMRGFWFDAGGKRAGPSRPISKPRPRLEFTTGVRVGSRALVAYTACGGSSICSPSTVQIAVLGPDGVSAPPRRVTPAGGSEGQPALAARDGRVALFTSRGYGGIALRRAKAGTARAAVRALSRAKVQTLSAKDSNYGGALALALTGKGAIAVHHDRDDRPVERVLFFPRGGGGPAIRASLPSTDNGIWGARRIASFAGGAVLVSIRQRGQSIDTVLRFFNADASAVVHTVVVGRSMTPKSPMVEVSGDGIAALWYEPRTDGTYAAFVDREGVRRAGPLRLDDPAKRASFGVPLLVRAKMRGRWHALWAEPYTGHYALYQTLVELP